MIAGKRDCRAIVDVAGQQYGCALEAPHTGLAHFSPLREGENAPAVSWCSDVEARKAIRERMRTDVK